MEIRQILQREFNSIKEDLISLYDEKGMRASGNWADELEVIIENDSAKILGLEYSQQLEDGRLPGKFPPIEAIEQWVKDKNITSIDNTISQSSLVFLIRRKIAQQGWKREGFGGVDLISEIVTDQRIESILEKITEASLFEISSEVQMEFANAFN